MSLIHESDPVQAQTLPELSAFWKTIALRKTLAQCCRQKQQGISLFQIFSTLFILVFRQRNFWRCSIGEKNPLPFERDTAYRFLNSPRHNWRNFLALLARKIILFITPLTSKEERRVFVVDDSLYPKVPAIL